MYDIFLASMYLKCNENFRNYEIAIHVIFLKTFFFLFYQESIADFQDGVIVHFFINLIATNYCLDNQFLRLKIFQGRFVTIQERIPSNFAQKFQTQSVKPCTTIQADNFFAFCFKNEILLRKNKLIQTSESCKNTQSYESAGSGEAICHSPLPDWIADAGELVLGADMGAPQDSRKGILAINSNSN